jgi:hypothetical protein
MSETIPDDWLRPAEVSRRVPARECTLFGRESAAILDSCPAIRPPAVAIRDLPIEIRDPVDLFRGFSRLIRDQSTLFLDFVSAFLG